MSRHVTQRLLQISDPHLFADPEGDLLGQRTRLTLEGVLNLARANSGAADRVLLIALVPLALLALGGHFVAIMASKRVRS